MNKEFGRIITNLRKKKGVSQKDVAAELGVSQALLSHYEKGIRECGLTFLVKLADYYNVSADYLLGRTQNPGAADNSEALAEYDEENEPTNVKINAYCMLNRRLVSASTAIIYSLLSEINNKKLSRHVSDYISVAHYTMFRKICSLWESSPDDVFTLSGSAVGQYCSAGLNLSEAKISEICDNKSIEGPGLSDDKLAEMFPDSYTSLYQLIKNSEKVLSQSFKI